MRANVVQLRSGEWEKGVGKVDQVDPQRGERWQQSRSRVLLVPVTRIEGSTKPLEKVDNLVPGVAPEPTADERRLSGTQLNLQKLVLSQIRVIATVELVTATTLIIVVLGNDAKVDMSDALTELGGQIGKSADGLRGGKRELVRLPEITSALNVKGLAGSEEVNSDMVAMGLLLVGQILECERGEWVNDRVR